MFMNTLVSESFIRLDSIDATRSPRLRRLYAYWVEIRGDRSMPTRADFDPARVVPLLPNISLLDVIADAPPESRFWMRLFGTELVRWHGSDWTGKTLYQNTDPIAAARLTAAGNVVVQSKAPWISTGKFYWVANRDFMRFEVLLLPLSLDEQNVDKILAITDFF